MHMLPFAFGLKLFLTGFRIISSLKGKKEAGVPNFLKITTIIKSSPQSRVGLDG